MSGWQWTASYLGLLVLVLAAVLADGGLWRTAFVFGTALGGYALGKSES